KSSSPTAADAPGRPRAPTPPRSTRTSRFRAHCSPPLLWLCRRIHGPLVSDRRPPRPSSPRPAAGAVPKDAPRGPAVVAPGAGPIPAQPVAPRRAREPRTMPYHSGTRRTEQRRSRHRRGEAEAAERVPTHGPTRGDPRPPPGPAAGCRRAPGFRLAPRAGAAARPVPTTGGDGADRLSDGPAVRPNSVIRVRHDGRETAPRRDRAHQIEQRHRVGATGNREHRGARRREEPGAIEVRAEAVEQRGHIHNDILA